MTRVVQGQSDITIVKQRDLRGIIKMRCLMLSGQMEADAINSLRIRDALCGDGENTVHGVAIDGSPLSILMGVQDACNSPKFRSQSHRVKLKFSDIRTDAVASLDRLVEQNFSHAPDLFAVNHYSSMVETETQLATSAIDGDHDWLKGSRYRRLFAFIDPNGPKYLPYAETAKLLTDKECRNRCDVVVHISATAVKRVMGNENAHKNMGEWIGNFSTIFVDALGKSEQAWIRVPIEGDRWQWTMLAYWSSPVPASDWSKRGFVHMNSPEGKAAIDAYATTRKMKVA